MCHPDSLRRDRAWFAHGYCAEGVDFRIRYFAPFITYDRRRTWSVGIDEIDQAIGEMSATIRDIRRRH